MPIPSAITDLSTTPGSNSPSGSEAPTEGDNHLRTAYAFIRELYNNKGNAADLGTSGTVTLGDALVAVKRTYTGAVATTLHAWIEGQAVNVKADYGADATGVASSTAAFTAALATGRSVYVPDGTYLVTGLSMTVDGQRLYGAGRNVTLVTDSTTAPVITMSGHRQTVENFIFNGGAVTGDASADFNAVKITGTRCIIQHCATAGVWARAFNLSSSSYCCVRDCNIDGFRKRGVSITGGTFNRVEDNMIFDASLTAPVTALVYVDNAPSTWVINNHITRGTGIGIYAVAESPNQTLLYIQNNDIDNLENWAISVDGYWDLHVTDNWCSAGQGAGSTGQIQLTSCNKFYVERNDIYGSLNTGKGLYVNLSNHGLVSQNTVEYSIDNIVVDSSNYIVISENISGQLTGLPDTGSVSQTAYKGVSLPDGNNCQWINNTAINVTVANYSGIGRAQIYEPRTLSTGASGEVLPPRGSDLLYPLGTASFRFTGVWAGSFYAGAGATFWTSGTGSPEGVVTAPIGSLFTRTNGSTSTTLYVKEAGAGNTGWVAK